MKRIISTLLSLSLVLSLLPAVALAEGEEATKWLEIPGSSEVLVDESELLYAIDETDNVAEETVTWTSADDSIVKVETATDDDLTNWGADPNEIKNRSAFVKITGLKVGTTTVTASTETRKALQDCTVTVTASVPDVYKRQVQTFGHFAYGVRHIKALLEKFFRFFKKPLD